LLSELENHRCSRKELPRGPSVGRTPEVDFIERSLLSQELEPIVVRDSD